MFVYMRQAGLPQIMTAVIVNNPLVLVTCILIAPFQTIIHYSDFYFSFCRF